MKPEIAADYNLVWAREPTVLTVRMTAPTPSFRYFVDFGIVDREVPGSFLVVEKDGPEPVPGKLYSKVLAWMPLSGLYDGPE